MSCFKTLLLINLMLVLAVSCRKDVPPVLTQQVSISLSTGKHLLICDEGNFGQNNAAISIYDPLSNAVILNAFSASNSNHTLGDVAQSIYKINGNYYSVMNNSGTIVVCNTNFTRLTTISGFISPRYIQYVYNDKAYVSNLQLNNTQPNYIQVVDILTNTISKSIRLDGWTEGMQLAHGNVYVCNQRKNYVYVINTQTDALTDSIDVGSTSAYIVKDENEKLWVSCNADAANNIPAKLVRINPATNAIDTSFSLQTTQNSISRLCINGTGTSLYYMLNDVFKMNINATACPSVPVVSQGTHNFYGLCIDPDDETIYISDATDYNSFGKLLRYQQSNVGYLGSYTVGVTPGFMMIDE